MKLWIAIGLAIVLGMAMGIGFSWWRIAKHPPLEDPFRAQKWQAPSGGDGQPGNGAPKIRLARETYDFGAQETDTDGSHDFLISNVGTAPLQLGEADSSCGCTVGKLEKTSIPPGETAKITIRWSLKDKLGEFNETVSITTNDPSWPQIILTVSGRITGTVRSEPGELVISQVIAGQKASGTLRLFSYLTEPMEIISHQWGRPDTQDFFEVALNPLTDDELRAELDATSGYLAKITINPGLPPGPFQQTISFQTNLEKHPTINVRIIGSVGSEISVVGFGWNSRDSVLQIGSIASQEGMERTLQLVVRGSRHKEVKFKFREAIPPLIEVDKEALTQSVEIPNKDRSQTALKFRIPPGARPAAHMGSERSKLGRITLETTHPEVPLLHIYLRFAITAN